VTAASRLLCARLFALSSRAVAGEESLLFWKSSGGRTTILDVRMKRREVVRQNHTSAKTASKNRIKSPLSAAREPGATNKPHSRRSRLSAESKDHEKKRDLSKILKLAMQLADAIDREDIALVADIASKIFGEAA
jgi:hypothetical protein